MSRLSRLTALATGLTLSTSLFAAGCATTTPAPGLLETEASLTKGRTQGTARSRPAQVEEARELLRRARQADARGEREKATLLARQALQTFVAAENQEGRDEANVALRALERNGVPAAASSSAAAAAPPPVERSVPRDYPSDLSRDAGRYPTSIVIERAAPVAPPAAVPGDASLRALAERTLVALQFKRSESIGQSKDQLCPPTFREFESLLDLSQKRFDAHDYERSYEFSVRADERFRACESHEAAGAKKKDDAVDAAKKKAIAAIQKAQTELARARTAVAATDPSLIQGAQLLHDGEGWLGRSAYPEAEDSATKAYAVLVKIKAGPAGAKAVDEKDKKGDEKGTADKKDKSADKKDTKADEKKDEPAKSGEPKRSASDEPKPAERTVAPVVITLDPGTEKQMQARIAAAPSEPAADPTWKRVYPVIFRALTLRDKTKELGGDKAEAALTEAEPRLAAAREAWTAKSYVAAETAALSAIATYEQALASATDDTRLAAEAALREASIAAQVCEKEACDKRDPAKLATGKELLASARRSLDAKRYVQAREEGERARTELDGALAVVRKDAADAAMDAATKQKLAAEATDALTAAGITRKVCEQKACATRDAEKWLRASESLRAASVAQTDERFARARDLAKEADKAMRELLGLPPGFEIPAGVTKVVKSGDVLKILPALAFTYAGKPTAASAAALDELARTLLANKAAIKRVTIVGHAYGKTSTYTQRTADNRGKSLRDALVARGIGADVLDPSGKVLPSGGDTSQQVEIRIELQEADR